MKEMMAKSAAAAKKKGRQRKKRGLRPPRPDPTRIHRPPPLEPRRSLRPRRRRPLEEEEEEDERGRRKLKLVLNIPHIPKRTEGRYSDSRVPSIRTRNPASAGHVSPSASSSSPSLVSSSSSSYVDDEGREEEVEEFDEDSIKPPKKRQIDSCDDAVASSDGSGHREEGKKNVVRRSVGSVSGALPASSTPLPERTSLELILDTLQKKDVYGVFAEPVNPEELTDYHDVIKHPMDFGTVRKKLAKGAYRSFEQFEDDVFLICSNAMQYNAPDTIYFRQAHAIQDMARKKFQKIRTDGKSTKTVRADSKSTETVKADGKYAETDCKSEEKIIFSSIEKKTPMKSECRTAQQSLGSDISSGATLASAGETFTGLNTVQASGIEISLSVNGFLDGSSSLGESKSEKADEISAMSSPSMLGLKPFLVDENRRATYNTSDQQLLTESYSVFDVFGSEPKQLVAVGLDTEYSYARSLARFAASLGHVAWEIASEKIEKTLPPGVKFGPGWVGEYEPLPTPVLSLGNHVHQHPSVLRKAQESEVELEDNRNCNQKDMPFGLKNQMITGTSNRASKPVKDGTFRKRTTERKPGLFGVNLETQPRINSVNTQQQKNQAAVSFAKSYSKETAARRPEFCSEAANSKFPVISSRERSQMQHKPQKQLEAVTCLSRNHGVSVMNAKGFSNGKPLGNSDSNRPNTSSGIISNHQTGVQYCLTRGNHEPAINDPLRLITSGKMSNQPNTSNKVSDNLEWLPTSLPARRENPSVAAAQAWMSIGSSSEWKSVDGGGLPKKQVRPASSSNSAWKTPPSASRVHEVPKIRPEPIQGVSEASQVQNKGLVIFPQLITTDLSRLRSPWQGLVQQNKPKDMLPPDLNIGYQPPGSPARPYSGTLVDSQQPDLALQL